MMNKGFRWYLDDLKAVHLPYTDVGISNIKIYGRELTKSNRNKPLEEDEVILYICGHREGYDGTEIGYMLKEDKFEELAVHIVKKYGVGISRRIKLDIEDLKAITNFLYSLSEDDLVGMIENKAEVLRKWTEEFLKILKTYRNKVVVFLELYE